MSSTSKIKALRLTLVFSIVLMIIKFIAYYLTNSVAVLSDALESIINVAAGAFALFSIYYSSQPQDADHPYGHGKIENLSAGFEGALIFIAGISILAEGIYGFFFPPELEKLDLGLAISGLAGLFNFLMGSYLVRKGKAYSSLAMVADGKHLISDTVSSVGLILGLGLIYITDLVWIDNVMAMIFGSIILFTGFKLVRESVTHLLDKADLQVLGKLVEVLNRHRRESWVDIHNLRVLKYGSRLHVDAHLTLPWYNSLEESHREMAELEKIVRENMGDEMEFFIHADPCLPASCTICALSNCKERKKEMIRKLEWNLENLLPDSKHQAVS